MRACMHAKQQERRAQSEGTSDRASERSLCDVCKFGLEQECGEDAAGRARVSTILSFSSPRSQREIFARRTAPLPRTAAFLQLRSPPPDLLLRLPRICYSIHEAKKRKEIQQFPRQQFLSSKS